ncbi:MAG: polyprenol monophosphomannose synthase [Candidatus Eisenbacteria bacterium]|nr:polyprenol monophosphomannose synthase [Candidatus Eisenbacteria bacterium]
MKTVIVIPTYNEKENLERLLPEVLAVSEGVEVLVVDDSSPDGTADVVRAMAERIPRVHLLERPGKMGLGSAYRDGFRRALDLGADLVMEMDADFSHDPKYIPDFLRAAQVADVVLGSRYMNGVNVINWPISRLILSYGANLYTRIVTGMPILDATGGFKCFRREVLEKIRFETSRSDGYSFQIELNYRCWRANYRIREIPIVFVDRHSGSSKMSKRIIWEAVWMVWRLRMGGLRRGEGRP